MTNVVAIQNQADSLPRLLERGQSLLDRPTMRVCSDPHRGRYLERIELPALTPEERETLLEMRQALMVRLGPAEDAAIITPLLRTANHHHKDRSAAEWKMLFEDYCDDLREFSAAFVQQACTEHRRDSNWFPKIAELRARCLELQALDKSRLERCERALAK